MALDASKVSEIAYRVSRYFSDFLESDFKKGKAPSRRIVMTTETGFRSAMRVAPYPAWIATFGRFWAGRVAAISRSTMEPRRYTRPISAALSKVIREQVLAIPETVVATVRNAVREEVVSTFAKAINNPEEWIESIRRNWQRGRWARRSCGPLIAHWTGRFGCRPIGSWIRCFPRKLT